MFYIRHHLASRRNHAALEQLGVHRVTFSRQVTRLQVRFLIDLLPAGPRFRGEPGVSYLVSADDKTVLFDLGYNREGSFYPRLRQNLDALDLETTRLDGIFISHNHLDHVGGLKYQRLAVPHLEQLHPDMLQGTPVWTPPDMHHPVCRAIEGPEELLPGLASTGSLPVHLYFLGPLHEQGLIIALEGGGVALIMGCGHPGAVKMVRHVKEITGQPVRALVGGLHMIAGKGRTRTQKYLGANCPPWSLPNLREVKADLEELKALGVQRLAPSAHDSCDAALATMKEVFKEGYSEVRAGGSVTLSP